MPGRWGGRGKDCLYIQVSENGSMGSFQEYLSKVCHIAFCFYQIIIMEFSSSIATFVSWQCFCSTTLLSSRHLYPHMFQDYQVQGPLMRPQWMQSYFKYVLPCTLINIVAYFLSLSKSLRLWWYLFFIYIILQKNCLSNTTIIIDFHNGHFNWNHLGFPKGSHSSAI